MLYQKINNENAHLTKKDWKQIKDLYKNRKIPNEKLIPEIKIVEHESPDSH